MPRASSKRSTGSPTSKKKTPAAAKKKTPAPKKAKPASFTAPPLLPPRAATGDDKKKGFTVTAALVGDNHAPFRLSKPLVRVGADGGGRRIDVQTGNLPQSAPVARVLKPLLAQIAKKFLAYYDQRTELNNEWIVANRGLLRDPSRHVMTFGDVTAVVIAILSWRRCTGFVVLQQSARALTVVTYFADRVLHHGTGFGTECPVAYHDNHEFQSRMRELVDDFFDRFPAQNPPFARFVERAVRSQKALRIGVTL